MKAKRKQKSIITPYTMIAPFFILYFTFSLFPMLFSLGVSFFNWSGFGQAKFIGIENYVRVFHDPNFYKAIKNTVIIFCFSIPIELALGLMTATALKDFFSKTRSAFQLFNFLPYITTPVAVGIIFSLMFDWKSGAVNGLLSVFGISSVYWLGLPWASRAVVVAMIVWKGYGYNMVMFLAGLSTIPGELYEAAKIDGASWWQGFRKITLPMLRPIFVFVVTTSIINAWKLFDEPQLLFAGNTQPIGGPERSVLTVIMRYYESAFRQFQFGYGSAIAYVLFIIIAIFSIVSVKSMNRDNTI
jgi:ABC-type sugar transport system permease subunit